MPSQRRRSYLPMAALLLVAGCGSGDPSAETIAAERAFVTSRLYDCEAERPQIYSVRQMREAGQLDDLSAADRVDIERLETIGVVGVGTEFTWTLWVPDRQCTVRDVELAD
jgi:hypothetical protein